MFQIEKLKYRRLPAKGEWYRQHLGPKKFHKKLSIPHWATPSDDESVHQTTESNLSPFSLEFIK